MARRCRSLASPCHSPTSWLTGPRPSADTCWRWELSPAPEVFSYHSCKNRSCPKCHTKQAKDWLDARKAEILPTDYFNVTITVPQELRALLRANQPVTATHY